MEKLSFSKGPEKGVLKSSENGVSQNFRFTLKSLKKNDVFTAWTTRQSFFSELFNNSASISFKQDFDPTSTRIALIKVLNDICLNNDSGKVSVLVLLDFSAAFDTVDHSFYYLDEKTGLDISS